MIHSFVKAVGTIGLSALALAVMVTSARPASHPTGPVRSTPSAIAGQATSDNLLANPDFEEGYTYPLPCCNNIAVPIGWNIRWYTDTATVLDNITYTFKQPEVKIIDNTVWPFCDGCAPNIPPRIHTGRYAVDSFVLFATQDVSFYQQVGDLPIGAVVTGTAWLHAWVSSCNPFPRGSDPLPAISLQGSNANGCPDGFWPDFSNRMMVGIDPFGGTDPRSSDVVWNWDTNNPQWWGPYDYYSSTLPAVTVAQAHTVTLFLRGVTQMPIRYDDVYFDTASLIDSFPMSTSVTIDQGWPLPVTATISVHTPVTLTRVSITATDSESHSLLIDFLDAVTDTSGVLARWRFYPVIAGRQVFTLTAYELTAPLVQSIEIEALPFAYWQDQLLPLDSGTITEPVYITCALSSPLALTNLTTTVTDPLGSAVVITPASSEVLDTGYVYRWQFAPQRTGVHTVTVDADEFTQPYEQFVLAAARRVYVPLIPRNASDLSN